MKMMLILSLLFAVVAYGAISPPVLTAQQRYDTVVTLIQNINADTTRTAQSKLDMVAMLRSSIVNLSALETQFGPIDSLALPAR